VREVALGAYAHQEVPFEKLVEELEPRRESSRSPLFQVLFVLQNTPPPRRRIGSLELQAMPLPQRNAKFDLSLAVNESSQGLVCELEYRTDLFEAETIERMLGHWQTLLQAVVREPRQRLSELPLLTEGEQQALARWNATREPYAYPEGESLQQLFERQVERSPEAEALVYEQQRLSYEQLNRRANQLAHYLRRRGVGPETLVGLCLERSVEMVVGLLGILKAGGAYVPLDPALPRPRLQFLLNDTQVSHLITSQALLEVLPEHTCQVLCLDQAWSLLSTLPEHNLPHYITPANLAYMIYTSGSTGQPKGAMNSQRAICNRIRWMQQAYQLGPQDSVLQKTPFSFDVSVWEFFWPLSTGARLVMARPGGHRDSAYLNECIEAYNITTIHFVPSMLQAFLSEADAHSCRSLRRVICSGEALSLELQARFFSRFASSEARLYNLYGPTEAAVDVSMWPCRLQSRAPAGPTLQTVPIGYPIANTRLYLLDQWMQHVPIGVVGHLSISGVQLARGYFNQPALTAERFIPDPWNPDEGARMYQTGDLGRYLPDGSIEFLGRSDHQIKLRGFRIELGEIEVALKQHPAIEECVVIAREDLPGEVQLVAYIICRHNEPVQVADLRAYLHEQLPAYMVPSFFVPLEQFPLSANGKLDRKALPKPSVEEMIEEQGFVAPRTPIEEVLAEIWCELFHLEQVSIHSNFFEIGGHSLLATQLVSHIQAVLQVELPLRCVFEAPTIERLASVVLEHADNLDDSLAAQLLAELEQLSPEQLQTPSAPYTSPDMNGNTTEDKHV
jgi:amino acid adenylation domain-containing protein